MVTKEEVLTYSDIVGWYPINSARGNEYILVCYYYDSNAIWTEALSSRSGACVKKCCPKLLDIFTIDGHNPKLQIVYNEACDILKKTLPNKKIIQQIVPPYIHLRNATERSIQTFKCHFIAGLCSTYPKYPDQEWYRLLP